MPIVFAQGVDIYHGDGTVDMQKLRNIDGLLFVCVKASDGYYMQGNTRLDPAFKMNYANAKVAKLLRSAYHFWRTDVSQATQIADFCGQLQDDVGELRPCFDLERNDGHLPSRVVASLAQQWLTGVETRLGIRPIVYTSGGFMTSPPNDPLYKYCDFMADYELWLAEYTGWSYIAVPKPWTKWTFWQYSDNTPLFGIQALGVDKDDFNGDGAALTAYAASLHSVTPPILPVVPFDQMTDADKWATVERVFKAQKYLDANGIPQV